MKLKPLKASIFAGFFITSCCCYEHKGQELVTHSSELSRAVSLCLMQLNLIKDTVRAVVLQPQADAQMVVDAAFR